MENFFWSSLVELLEVNSRSSPTWDWSRPLEFLTLRFVQTHPLAIFQLQFRFSSTNTSSCRGSSSWVAAPESWNSLYSLPVYGSNFKGSILPCDLTSLTELTCWFFSLFKSLLLVRTEWWLSSSLHAWPETWSPYSLLIFNQSNRIHILRVKWNARARNANQQPSLSLLLCLKSPDTQFPKKTTSYSWQCFFLNLLPFFWAVFSDIFFYFENVYSLSWIWKI